LEKRQPIWYGEDMMSREKLKQDAIGIIVVLGIIATIIAIFGGF